MLSWLFDTQGYVKLGPGVGLDDSLAYAHHLANLNIAFAYFLINAMLMILWWNRREGLSKRSWIVWLYIGFIFSSGNSRLIYALLYDIPLYNLAIVWDIMTAVAAWMAAIVVPIVVWTRILQPDAKLVELSDKLERVELDKERIHAEKNHLASAVAQKELAILQLKTQNAVLRKIREKLTEKTDMDEVIARISETASQLESLDLEH